MDGQADRFAISISRISMLKLDNKNQLKNSLFFSGYFTCTLWFKKNVPTSADCNYDPVMSILIIFSKLFVSDHKSCLVVKFSTSPHMLPLYLVKHNALFCTNYTAYRKQEVKVIWQKAPHGGPIPRSGVTPGGRKLYHWIPGVGFPISVP